MRAEAKCALVDGVMAVALAVFAAVSGVAEAWVAAAANAIAALLVLRGSLVYTALSMSLVLAAIASLFSRHDQLFSVAMSVFAAGFAVSIIGIEEGSRIGFASGFALIAAAIGLICIRVANFALTGG